MDLAEPTNPFKDIQDGSVITLDFDSGGVNYWEVKDVFNTYVLRAMEALAVYEQWEMRCTVEYLRSHIAAMKASVNKGMLTEVVQLYNNLEERLNFAIPTEDIIWHFAAVKYFDENESPYKYDHEYAKEKINKWRKERKVVDFFSLLPIKELIPSPKLSDTDLEGYLKTVNMISQKHLKQVFDTLSPQVQNKDFYQALLYQKSLQSTPAV